MNTHLYIWHFLTSAKMQIQTDTQTHTQTQTHSNLHTYCVEGVGVVCIWAFSEKVSVCDIQSISRGWEAITNWTDQFRFFSPWTNSRETQALLRLLISLTLLPALLPFRSHYFSSISSSLSVLSPIPLSLALISSPCSVSISHSPSLALFHTQLLGCSTVPLKLSMVGCLSVLISRSDSQGGIEGRAG